MPSRLSVTALAARIRAGTAPAIVDVRSMWEFDRGHVPGAQHVPFWNVTAHLGEVQAHKDDEIVVYCGHGPRAQMAKAAFERSGFRHVVLLEGHWAKWKRAHLDVEFDNNRRRK